MRKLTPSILTSLFLFFAVPAMAGLDVKMTGDARIYGSFFQGQNFTSWNATGTRTEEPFIIWQRFRLRTDFKTGEALAFRLGVRINDTNWGGSQFEVDNAAVGPEVYQAYLQFNYPGTDVRITAGLQPVSLPQSSIFYDSPVLSSKHASNSSTALIIEAPIVKDRASVILGFDRLVDTNQRYDTDTTQVDDELDAFFAAFPLTFDGVGLTPWTMAAVAGRDASYPSYIRNNLVSGGYFLSSSGFADNQTLYWWGGGSLELSTFDPFRFYADLIYGQGAMSGPARNKRWGWFADAAVEYRGFSFMIPQLGAWWSSGEDESVANGSERMPAVNSNFGMAGSFLFPCDQYFTKDNLAIDPTGSFGATFALSDINFIDKLTNRVTFTAMSGTSSPAGLRKAVLASGGNGQYVTMGKNLAQGEWVVGATLDASYAIYQNLALQLETGWAKFSGYESSTWNYYRNFTGAVQDSWKVMFGLNYKF